jgi:hypothetical protein
MPNAKYRTHCASDNEDSPVVTTAERLGFSPAKGDILFVRSASDIEEEPLLPRRWSTDRMIRFLQSPDGFPGIVPAFNSGWKVASTIAHYLLDHPGLKFTSITSARDRNPVAGLVRPEVKISMKAMRRRHRHLSRHSG